MIELTLSISLVQPKEFHGWFHGAINFGNQTETFEASSAAFQVEDYQNQWKSAVQRVLEKRLPAAIFTNVDLDDRGIGWLWYYSLIPSEEVGSSENSSENVYVTHSFLPVCTKPEQFLERRFLEYDDGSRGEEVSSYFLDLDCPERFFGYVDTSIDGRSHWEIHRPDLEAFLSDH